MKVALMRADGVHIWTEIEGPPSLEYLQAAVGGYIEGVPMPKSWGPGIMYCNEEGLLHALPYNHAATEIMRRAWIEDCFSRGEYPTKVLDFGMMHLVGDVIWVEHPE